MCLHAANYIRISMDDLGNGIRFGSYVSGSDRSTELKPNTKWQIWYVAWMCVLGIQSKMRPSEPVLYIIDGLSKVM
jgi:hypothetical protein